MNWLEDFKRRWTESEQRRGAGAGWLDESLLLREVVIRLALEEVQPADLFDRPMLVELIEAARLAFPEACRRKGGPRELTA